LNEESETPTSSESLQSDVPRFSFSEDEQEDLQPDDMSNPDPAKGDDAVVATKPIVGGLIKISTKETAAWTGGKPKRDWSGPEVEAKHYKSPNQLRSVHNPQKGYNHRKMGLMDKFDRKGDLSTFRLKTWKHLVDTGMDAIAYVPDPVDDKRMTNCVLEHVRFSLESITTQVKLVQDKYDQYDQENSEAATEFALTSLEPSFEADLREMLTADHTKPFAVVWMHIVESGRRPL
jgi:hypothetical protein